MKAFFTREGKKGSVIRLHPDHDAERVVIEEMRERAIKQWVAQIKFLEGDLLLYIEEPPPRIDVDELRKAQ